MLELRERLERAGIAVAWYEHSDSSNVADASRSFDLTRLLEKLNAPDAPNTIVIDARDIDPTLFATAGRRVLALDNRHPVRDAIAMNSKNARVEFYDTIPHPQAQLALTLEQALIRADVLELREKKSQPQPRSIFVYSGDFFVPALDRILARMAVAGWSVHRCGAQAPEEAITGTLKQSGFRWSPRLERDVYCAELSRSEFVGAYFGMTVLEAWYLQRTPFLFSVTSVIHNELGMYLNRSAGLPFIDAEKMLHDAAGDADRALGAIFASVGARTTSGGATIAPGGQGFDRLVARVRGLIYSAGASSADTV